MSSCDLSGTRYRPCLARTRLVVTPAGALSDPTRVAIVNRFASTEACCVCDLTAAFELSQPTISHHLKVLRELRHTLGG